MYYDLSVNQLFYSRYTSLIFFSFSTEYLHSTNIVPGHKTIPRKSLHLKRDRSQRPGRSRSLCAVMLPVSASGHIWTSGLLEGRQCGEDPPAVVSAPLVFHPFTPGLGAPWLYMNMADRSPVYTGSGSAVAVPGHG